MILCYSFLRKASSNQPVMTWQSNCIGILETCLKRNLQLVFPLVNSRHQLNYLSRLSTVFDLLGKSHTQCTKHQQGQHGC